MPAFSGFRNPQRSAATPPVSKTLRPWPEPQSTISESKLFFVSHKTRVRKLKTNLPRRKDINSSPNFMSFMTFMVSIKIPGVAGIEKKQFKHEVHE